MSCDSCEAFPYNSPVFLWGISWDCNLRARTPLIFAISEELLPTGTSPRGSPSPLMISHEEAQRGLRGHR